MAVGNDEVVSKVLLATLCYFYWCFVVALTYGTTKFHKEHTKKHKE